MTYFLIRPEVAGGIGEETVMDRRVHPPMVSRLHYDFDGWGGDAILTSFPAYIVTEDAMRAIKTDGLSGVTFDSLLVTTSDDFVERQPDTRLPRFVWMKVLGTAGVDDFGLTPPARLVVSERALATLQRLGIANARVEPLQ